ncbi:MAG: hypothetical protein Q4A54_10785 [Parabacteroides sp.]|nr:hypothetical protein [Parabacteroides sp.]
MNIQPKWDVINAMPTAELPFDKNEIKFKEVDGKTYIRFPLSVIGLEPGWMSHSYPCSYIWDPTRFPNPEQFV